jgi:quinol monooxygenase YgiN
MKSLTESEEVYWMLVLKIASGQEARFKELSAKLVASAQEEEGCLNYEWSLTADGGTCHIYERYADSAAVKLHGERSHALVGQLLAVSAPVSFGLFGAPDDDVKRELAGLNPVLLTPLGGFAR